MAAVNGMPCFHIDAAPLTFLYTLCSAIYTWIHVHCTIYMYTHRNTDMYIHCASVSETFEIKTPPSIVRIGTHMNLSAIWEIFALSHVLEERVII